MQFFDTNKLTQGKKKVEQVIDAAESLGLDIIKVQHTRAGAHISGFSTFEVPKTIVDSSGMGTSASLEIDYFYVYPDKNLNRHGFILDTDHNRGMLKALIRMNKLVVKDKRVMEELITEVEDAGGSLVPNAPVSPIQPKTNTVKKAEINVKRKEQQIEEGLARLQKYEEQLKERERELTQAENRVIEKTSTTAVVEEANEETGRIEETVVEAESPVKTEDKRGKTNQPKKGKALSGKTTKRAKK
jgi:hypothetical protein